MGFGDIIGGVLGSALMGNSIPSLINTAVNWKTAQKNYKLQKRNYDLQRLSMLHTVNQQREAWDREDSATQRRAADLQAAGINPILAAGSAAGSMAPVQVHPPPHAPQLDFQASLGESSVLLNMLHTFGELEHKKAQNILLSAQAATEKERERYQKALADEKEWETEWSETGGMSYRAQTLEWQMGKVYEDYMTQKISRQRAEVEFEELMTGRVLMAVGEKLHGPMRERLQAEINSLVRQTDLTNVNFRRLNRELEKIDELGLISVPSGPVGDAAQLASAVITILKRALGIE